MNLYIIGFLDTLIADGLFFVLYLSLDLKSYFGLPPFNNIAFMFILPLVVVTLHLYLQKKVEMNFKNLLKSWLGVFIGVPIIFFIVLTVATIISGGK